MTTRTRVRGVVKHCFVDDDADVLSRRDVLKLNDRFEDRDLRRGIVLRRRRVASEFPRRSGAFSKKERFS